MKRHAKWLPRAIEPADIIAVQALEQGKANHDQQKRALALIINNFALTYEDTYMPGVEGNRDTDFMNGRRHVGLEIINLLKLDAGRIIDIKQRRKEHDDTKKAPFPRKG